MFSGIGIAFFYISLAVTLSIANRYIEKSAQKPLQALAEIDRQVALEKEPKPYQRERPKPVPVISFPVVEKETEHKFESPQVELLAELIDEPDDEDSGPASLPAEPPVGKPLRLPGRIYRGDE